ncbi:MAG: MBL fold metallo-hydrolase [Candidatus Thorarchaeota archaeon]|nr:MAG: MBL fold metallo-hydrolase [Candidatus Thorarchaeota archaeon]
MRVSIRWLGHSGFQIKAAEHVIYLDLYRSKKLIERVPDVSDPATIVLVSHSHNDHCYPDAINEVRTDSTTVVAPANCAEKLGSNITSLEPGEETTIQGVDIKAVQAYNVKRFRSPGNPYHPKGYGVGYLLKVEGNTIYFAGDTDVIPEMEELGQIDVALLPCGDTYTMDNLDAAEATKTIRPKVVIPMHTWDRSVEEFQNAVEEEKDTNFVSLKEGEEFTL